MRVPAEHVQRVRDEVRHGVDVVEARRAVAVVDHHLNTADVEPGCTRDPLRRLDDLGGVELVVDDRDGTPRFYDINAMSNFVADPLNVLGWDPHDRLIDFLEAQLKGRQAA